MVETLERGSSAVAHAPRRSRRAIYVVVGSLIIVIVGVLGFVFWPRPAPEPDCASAAGTGPMPFAVDVCRREYSQSKLPRTGARLADLLRATDNIAGADELARSLLGSDARADALQTLAKIA